MADRRQNRTPPAPLRPGGAGLPRQRGELRPEQLQAKVSVAFRKRLDRVIAAHRITRSQWLYDTALAQLERDELPPAPLSPSGAARLAVAEPLVLELEEHRDPSAPASVAPLARLRLSDGRHALSIMLDASHLRRAAAELERLARDLESYDPSAALALESK